jgi:uncharacterized protein YprB with RNaseH-like and TPR domain
MVDYMMYTRHKETFFAEDNRRTNMKPKECTSIVNYNRQVGKKKQKTKSTHIHEEQAEPVQVNRDCG